MRRISFLILSVLVLGTLMQGCDNKAETGVPVTGKIENTIPDQPVVLTVFGEGGLNPVDTVEVQEDGSFEFYVDVTVPSFYRLNIHNRRQVNLILDGSETDVNIAVDVKDLQIPPTVTGAPENKHLDYFDKLVANMREDEQMLNQQGMQARSEGNESEMRELSGEYNTLLENFYENVKGYAHKIKPSLAVFYGIGSLRPEDHFPFYDSLASFYKQNLPDHVFTKDLVTRVNSMRSLAVGAQAPEISLPNPDGKTITLSSLRGNYVLIDFWAAWCKPCRMENPNVLRVYKEYQDKNFEILGVSLDRNREAWVKAIQSDGLIWKHASDLKYFRSEAAQDYQINSIPATYLIDPSGKIVAKGLRGASLEAKLKEIFG